MTQRIELSLDEFTPYFKVEDGNLIRLYDCKRAKAGSIVGTKKADGYLTFGHNNKYYFVHRIIFLLHHGYCPTFVDHINGNVSDNRIENLREADSKTNTWNQKITTRNTSGCKGVHRLKNGDGFQASITYNRKRKFLGLFETFEDAREFITLARDMVHGAYANHGVMQ